MQFHSINPISHCPHQNELINTNINPNDIEYLCSKCNCINEPWICLTCGICLCGRFDNKHMIEHVKEANHFIVLGFEDLSVWCYGISDNCNGCDYYINEVFINIYSLLIIKCMIYG